MDISAKNVFFLDGSPLHGRKARIRNEGRRFSIQKREVGGGVTYKGGWLNK